MPGFRKTEMLKKFTNVQAQIYNLERHLVPRPIYKLRRVAAQIAWSLIAA